MAFDIMNSNGVVISNNQCNSGISLRNVDKAVITDNRIVALEEDAYAIDGYGLNNIEVRHNFLRSGRGVRMSSDTTYAFGNIVNNVIIASSKLSNGITLRDIKGLNFLHNSVSSHGNGCLSFTSSKQSVFRNNIFAHFNTSGNVIDWPEGNSAFKQNNLYTNSNYLFYYKTKYFNSLTDLDDIPGFSNHKCISANPEWVDNFMDLSLTLNSPEMKGGNVGVDLDFYENRRCITSPTMGAYELIQPGTPEAYFAVVDTAYLSSTAENVLNLKSEFDNGSAFENTWYDGNWEPLGNGVTFKLKLDRVGKHTISLVQGNCQKADTFTKTIVVVDTIKPVVSGATVLYARQCSGFNPFNELKIFDHDSYFVDTLTFWPVSTLDVGNFPFQIEVTDNSGNSTLFKTNIIVSDSLAPEINIVVGTLQTIYEWSELYDSVVVSDQCNDVSTILIEKQSNVDTAVSEGVFTEKYWAIDHVGNVSDTAFRFVTKLLASVNSIKVSDVNIYPNPSNGQIAIEFTEGQFSEYEYSVQTLNGKTLESGRITEQMHMLDLKVSKGVYLIYLKNNESTTYKKLIVN